MGKDTETVSVRVPKALWMRVRRVALERGETGLSWFSRCVERALGAEAGSHAGPMVVTMPTNEDYGALVPEPPPRKTVPLSLPTNPRMTRTVVGIEPPRDMPRETSSDPWSAKCGTCGHPKRAHLGPKGDLARCGFGQNCGCRAFVEGAPGDGACGD